MEQSKVEHTSSLICVCVGDEIGRELPHACDQELLEHPQLRVEERVRFSYVFLIYLYKELFININIFINVKFKFTLNRRGEIILIIFIL